MRTWSCFRWLSGATDRACTGTRPRHWCWCTTGSGAAAVLGAGLGVSPQAAQPGDAMRALSLLGVLIVAKAASACRAATPWSPWTTVAYFTGCSSPCSWPRSTRRRGAGAWWVLYAVAVAWIALNVPVALVAWSPLTWRMIGRRAGPLPFDRSISSANLLRIFVCLAVGVVLRSRCADSSSNRAPRVRRRWSRSRSWSWRWGRRR